MEQILKNASQIAEIISARRRKLKIVQGELAAKLGITQSAISQIESQATPISLQRFLDIANVLNLEVVVQERKPKPKADW